MISRRAFVSAAFALGATTAHAEPVGRRKKEWALWDGVAPGSEGLDLVEQTVERSRDPAQHDRAVTGITRPSLTLLAPARPNGAAVILMPGGAYQREAIDKEGFDVGRWFSARGVSAFVLKYRLPSEGHAARTLVALRDAARAVRLVRANAKKLGLDAQRIGVLGASAGGHLAASLAVRAAEPLYDAQGDVDSLSARPDFLVLLYPVISMENPFAHAGSRQALLGDQPELTAIRQASPDLLVSAASPPTFLVAASDDQSVSPENALRFYRALSSAGVAAELHLFPEGGHGFGLRSAPRLAVSHWPNLMWQWLRAGGVIRDQRLRAR